MLHFDTAEPESLTHTCRGHSAGSMKVRQVCSCSCCIAAVQFVSEPWHHRDSVFPSVQLFTPQCEPQSHLCTNLTWHQSFVNVGRAHIWSHDVSVCGDTGEQDAGFFKNQPLFVSQIQYKQWSWLVKGELGPWTPQWGIYYSNYQRNVLLISHIYLFFPCFDRNPYINIHQQRETDQQNAWSFLYLTAPHGTITAVTLLRYVLVGHSFQFYL